jgi:hypothetical protein
MGFVSILPAGELGTLCPVCGFDLGFSVYEKEERPDAICPSCGIHFGYDDMKARKIQYLEWRRGWIDAHMRWGGFRADGVVTTPPPEWDPVVQLKRVRVDLGHDFASWQDANPVQVWSNRDVFLARILAGLEKQNVHPAAVEALWDGDTSGWFLRFSAVVQTATGGDRRFGAIHLGDFQGPDTVALVRYLGETVAEHHGVSFFFPSPDKEEDDCPHWWQQDLAVRCSSCNVLLLCSFRNSGFCHRCYGH